jgi:hypothetical protein
MKRITYLSAIVIATIIVTVSSCDSKREPGKVYMPDMAYSRAYETYAWRDTAKFSMNALEAYDKHKIYYNALPVNGTMQREELFPFSVVPNNTNGVTDSNAINLSSQVKNPLGPLTAPDSLEASRLFNINCAICHGSKAEANGPVASKIGGVKSIIAAATGSATAPAYSDGKIFYIMTYGQNNMGSYASQLSRKQRWMIVQYIRSLQPKAAAPGTAAPKTDSAAVVKK